ncbi:MAG: stage V sporulation protein AC [Clostridia bacterium]|nr:stage V sporulation protein AC [Clostridia bacterium]
MDFEKLSMTNEDYINYVQQKSKKSPIFKNLALAFLVGGLFCILGQALTDIFEYFNYEKKVASTIATIILVFLGAFLTSINVYSKLGKYAGAGSIVPITGFSNSIVATAIEYKSEGYILGLGANMFKVAGPVIVYGITSSVVIGFFYWLIKLFI